MLVHGFTASPHEMRPVAERLAQAGIASYAVRLPGHGATPADLSRRRWQEWLHEVETGYQLLKSDFDTVSGIGMSTGCLLLALLATNHPLQKLVLFSPYLRIRHKLAPLAGWLRWVKPYHGKPTQLADPHYYQRRPVAGVHQINLLIKTLKPMLPQVDCPTLAFTAENDKIVDPNSGEELIKRLGSASKEHIRLGPEVGHVMIAPETPGREEIFAKMINFIQESAG
ncbi:MAG: alpha/beta fold hydrolase [Desulfuromonadales bacterium]|nr:alpha/beta fold hydrolase [Desulfuromonadales bacterium]